ncbi:pectinesterase [Dorcoceras hygrometricum]|uniref:Pectinesterase n=1 Tax=Dorcoceras hygrometricum TaxID=472368 RepID=A0A2Z7AMV3_9LAMI|nr:pectinesterase [Dorcoceras hygrometricum]
MQHAIINAMKCMRAIKDRIARPVYQLAIISIEPLYHAQQVRSTSYCSSNSVVEKCYSRNLITVTSFCSQQNQSQQPVIVFSKEHQNDTVPTNSNDIAELHQLTTDISCETTKSCQYLCDPQWFRDTASRGLTTIVTPKSQFRIDPSDHVELAMETSRVKSVVRNQAEAKLNQLEHDEPAETMNQLQALKRKDEPAVHAQRIEEVAKRSSRSDKQAAKQLTIYESWMTTAERNSNGESDEVKLSTIIRERALLQLTVELELAFSHTVEAVVHLRSLGVLTAAGCGIGSVHAVVRSNLLVEPSEVEEGEM